MALLLLAANNAQTVLAAGISSSATTLTVNTGTGSLFPSPVSGTSFFKLTLVDAATGQLTEVMHVTARSGDTMTVVRAQEGTASRAWSANDIAANMLTAGSLSFFAQNESPAFTGTPTAPTAAGGTNTTQLATTAFVAAAIGALGTAASRNVGTGTNQLPDMNSFTSLIGSSQGSSGWQKLPSGLIIQWYTATMTGSGNQTFNFPIPFPNYFLSDSITPGGSGSSTVNGGNVSKTSRQFYANAAMSISVICIGW